MKLGYDCPPPFDDWDIFWLDALKIAQTCVAAWSIFLLLGRSLYCIDELLGELYWPY